MMSIGLADLMVAMMFIGVSLVCVLWFFTFWQERRREIHRRRIAIQCRICGCAYATGKGAPQVTVCPACGSRNERHGWTPI